MARAPFAYWRPIPSKTDPKIVPIGVILHVDGGNARSLYHWFNGPSGGIESHFHVDRDGHVEQYRDTEQEADANYKGNSFILDVDLPEMGIRKGTRVGFISVETQGYASGEWTGAQLDAIKRVLTFAHDEHRIPLKVTPAWNRPGVGYHVMWGAPGAWTNVSKTCPGPDRIKQFNEIIVPWMEEPMSKISKPNWLPDSVLQRLVKVGYLTKIPERETEDMWRVYAFMDRMDTRLRTAIKTAGTAGGVGAAAVIAEIVNRLS